MNPHAEEQIARVWAVTTLLFLLAGLVVAVLG